MDMSDYITTDGGKDGKSLKKVKIRKVPAPPGTTLRPKRMVRIVCKDCGSDRVLASHGRCMDCQVHFEILREKGWTIE